MSFTLHPQLQSDTLHITDLNLCSVLLMNDTNYPWLILVPQKADISEIYQLSPADQQQLLKEIDFVSKKLAVALKADKINIAALGNVVPQLHIHIIARYKIDVAWPKPVWGIVPALPYSPLALRDIIKRIQLELSEWKKHN